MSSTRVTPAAVPALPEVRPVRPPAAVRRVRHQARDVLAVMAFSLGTSVLLAAGLLALTVVLAPSR